MSIFAKSKNKQYNKSKFLKNILTTASLLAITSGEASEVFAAAAAAPAGGVRRNLVMVPHQRVISDCDGTQWARRNFISTDGQDNIFFASDNQILDLHVSRATGVVNNVVRARRDGKGDEALIALEFEHKNLVIGDINLYGHLDTKINFEPFLEDPLGDNDTVVEDPADDPKLTYTVNNVINDIGLVQQNLVTAARGIAGVLAPGVANGEKVKFVLNHKSSGAARDTPNADLIIQGNNLSALGSVEFKAANILTLNGSTTLDTKFFFGEGGTYRGVIFAEGNLIFNERLGGDKGKDKIADGKEIDIGGGGLGTLVIGRSTTLKKDSNIQYIIFRNADSKLVLNAGANNIELISAGIHSEQSVGKMLLQGDKAGYIKVTTGKNKEAKIFGGIGTVGRRIRSLEATGSGSLDLRGDLFTQALNIEDTQVAFNGAQLVLTGRNDFTADLIGERILELSVPVENKMDADGRFNDLKDQKTKTINGAGAAAALEFKATYPNRAAEVEEFRGGAVEELTEEFAALEPPRAEQPNELEIEERIEQIVFRETAKIKTRITNAADRKYLIDRNELIDTECKATSPEYRRLAAGDPEELAAANFELAINDTDLGEVYFKRDGQLKLKGFVLGNVVAKNDFEGEVRIVDNTEFYGRFAQVWDGVKAANKGRPMRALVFDGNVELKLSEHALIGEAQFGFIGTENDGKGKLILAGDRVLDRDIGQRDKALAEIGFSTEDAKIVLDTSGVYTKKFSLLEGQTFTVNNGVSLRGNISGGGNLIFAGTNKVDTELGGMQLIKGGDGKFIKGGDGKFLEKLVKLANISAGRGEVEFRNKIFVEKLNLTGSKLVKIMDRASQIDTVALGHENAQLRFDNGSETAVNIEADAPGFGNVFYNGAGRLGQVGAAEAFIGRLVFSGDGVRTLEGSIYTNNITFDAGRINAADPTLTITASGIVEAPEGWFIRADNVDGVHDRKLLITVEERDRPAREAAARRAAEEAARIAAEEAARIAAEEAARIAAEEAAARRVAEEAEARRVADEERAVREILEVTRREAELARVAREAEAARIAEERRAREAEAARIAEERRAREAEERRVARAAEERRVAEEAAARRVTEERTAREAEERAIREMLEATRREAEAARLASEESERRDRAAREAEAARIAEERRAREAEAARIAEERRAEVARVRELERARGEEMARSREAERLRMVALEEEARRASATETAIEELRATERATEQVWVMIDKIHDQDIDVSRSLEADISAENARRDSAPVASTEKQVSSTEAIIFMDLVADVGRVSESVMTNELVVREQSLMAEVSAPVVNNIEAVLESAKKLEDRGIVFKKEVVEAIVVDEVKLAKKSGQEKAVLFAAAVSQMDQPKQQKVVNDLKTQASNQSDVSKVATNVVGEAISVRIDSVGSLSSPVVGEGVNSGDTGLSAGDDDSTMAKGVWVSGLYGQASKDKSKTEKGYSGSVAGGTLGFDLSLTDNSLVGVAYSNVRSGFDYEDKSSKIEAASHSFSVYGQQQIGENFVLQGLGAYTTSEVSTKTKKEVANNLFKTATAKFKSSSITGEATIGYKIGNDMGLVLMPNIGVKFASYKNDGYKEKGAGLMNLEVQGSSSQKVGAVAGIKMMAPRMLDGGVVVTPSLNVSAENYFGDSKKAVKAKLGWMNNYFESKNDNSENKLGFNVGGGLMAKRDSLELSANYNCHIESKFMSHQGSLKLKLSF